MKQDKPKVIKPEQALIRLETLCARGEHSTRELREKLRRWAIDPGDADKIIESLTKRRFVDDERFARAYINDKFRFARWGRRKIAVGLAGKGIPSSIYRDLFAEIDQTEYETILSDLLLAKSRSIEEPKTYEGRTKLYRFGISRGYESETVSHLIRLLFV